MEKEKINPYRSLEGAHYGVKEKFSSYEERINFLSNYAKEAKRIYEKYKENPEKIKDEEERKNLNNLTYINNSKVM